jgi:hypothetical protein
VNTLDAAQVVRDVAANVPPDKSKVKYTPELRAFRAEVTAEWEKVLVRNPEMRLEPPADIDGLP